MDTESDDEVEVAYHDRDYASLSEDTKLARRDLALGAVLHDPALYAHVPPALREGDWALADAAVNRDINTYRHVPLSMRTIPPAPFPPPVAESILDLARRATRVDTRYHTSGPHPWDAHQAFMTLRPTEISSPALWRSSALPATTRRHLLSHLYTTNEHAHLRAMGQFAPARASLQQLDDRAGSWFQKLTLRPPPTEDDDEAPKKTTLLNLSGDTLRDLTNRASTLKTREADHETWAKIQLRDLWYFLNMFLRHCRTGERQHHYQADLSACLEKTDAIVTFFCDPHYAWALDARDAPILGPPPLSPAQRAFARTVANHVWDIVDVIRHISNYIEGRHLEGPSVLNVREYSRIPRRLHELGFDMTQLSPWTQLAARYLNRHLVPARAFREKLFCDKYPDQFPHFDSGPI